MTTLTRTNIRYLVFISLLANVVWISYRHLLWETFEPTTRDLLSADGYGSTIPGSDIVFLIVVAVSAACYIGLFFFRLWAVWLSLFLDIGVVALLAPFGGVEVSAPLERIARAVLLMVDGAVISLAFFSDAHTYFEDSRTASRHR